ncbi:MAG: hypothetical protein A3I77_05695 [Gammaproteobacteria bacterium RIFCSPLOWO2_02_FULL_42_14]|nr:MAG: hypothetical protein A3B71_00420 [Gammaproteobacteria bacterium RIFCSPHIGHO2_02_FULL_42_43]OGT27572.1 MAG: hypothetical protein A2624_01890 [Gammaproteobacteria bacterium RIFCSPHIGHO2_01_FULL_42_8]OGT53687.1 MAG: hypothetical protein A3E54_00435 [Gammaproteobacteria bacterium RIFCSPHIGHO2_12_FULL_41_25]OGT62752.1 MAG: hypothetical protein A3I77_05695 [Gammaproteobacteria bacterium RIFCSPLOWO2_02_FULL_42_14]OGT85587.1 MAG: hypothetical protein A3G86_02205 [Gammaproteobacteria bacterium R
MRARHLFILVFFWLSVFLFSAYADEIPHAKNLFVPDDRSQLPAVLNNSYLGVAAGYIRTPFSNADMLNGFQANSFNTESYAPMIFIGHYYNPYLATEINMIGRLNVFAHLPSGGKKIIHMSIFSALLRPTLPVTRRFSLHGLLGFGTISRSGFSVNNATAVSTKNLISLITGGGISYAVLPYLNLTAGLMYAPPGADQQPSTTYIYAGFYFLLHRLHLPAYYSDHFIFHRHLIQFGAFTDVIFNPRDVNQYFSSTDSDFPIFWSGSVALRNGAWIRYEKNIFHTHKFFSLDWGASVSTYYSKVDDTSIQAFSLYPVMRLWFLHFPKADFYFSYSAAGLTYLTRRFLDGRDLGSQFIFQDLMGIGGFFGEKKHFNVSIGIGHYSNGNLFPRNPGIDVPLTLTAGYAFS